MRQKWNKFATYGAISPNIGLKCGEFATYFFRTHY